MDSSTSAFLAKDFNSYEEFSQLTYGWDIDFIQLSPGPFQASFLQFLEDDFQFSKSYFGNHLHQRGTAPNEKITFTIHHTDSVANKWRYLHCPLHSITVYPDNNELQSVCMPGMHKFTLSFEEQFLQSISDSIGLPPLEDYLNKGQIALCDPDQIRYLQNYLDILTHHLIDRQNEGAPPLIAGEMKQEIARLLLLALSASTSRRSGREPGGRVQMVEKIIGSIHANPAATPSVRELSTLAGLSEQKLRDLFYETFQTAPEDYLTSYRSNLVRKFLGGIG